MTAAVDITKADTTVEIKTAASTEHLAGWLARAGAFAVDVIFGVALVATMAVLQAATPQYSVLWWYYVSIAVLTAVAVVCNRLVLPAVRGWSLGRALFGIAVVRADVAPAGKIRARVGKYPVLFGVGLVVALIAAAALRQSRELPWWIYLAVAVVSILASLALRQILRRSREESVDPGDDTSVDIVRLVLRDFAHLLDTLAIGIGWLWPLWDQKNRTFADRLTRTEVHRVRRNEGVRRPDVRRLTAVAALVVTLLCATGVGLNYAVVYRYERAVDSARAQIMERGPSIVEQILSYAADTRGADFASAQTLVTEAYRPQLVEQQLAVASAPPFTNEFWTVNAAVLSVTPDTASMLLMMQGRRATSDADARFITGTVRASFEKGADTAWRVSDLVVLTKPRPELEVEQP